MRSITIYTPAPTGWYRCSASVGTTELQYPAIVARAADPAHVPQGMAGGGQGNTPPSVPPLSTESVLTDPNGVVCLPQQPAQLFAALAPAAGSTSKPFMLGDHAPILLDFCSGNARWLEVRRNPEAVERLRSDAAIVTSRAQDGWRGITRQNIAAARAALAATITAVLPLAAAAGSAPPPAGPPAGAAPAPVRARLAPGLPWLTFPVRQVAAAVRAPPPPAQGIPPESADAGADIWLTSWAAPPPAPPPAGTTPPAALEPASITAAFTRVRGQLVNPLLPLVPTLTVEGPAAVQRVLAFAAVCLDRAAGRTGLAAQWIRLTVEESTTMRALHQISVPLVPLQPTTQAVDDRVAPYEVSSLFTDMSGGHALRQARRFALNHALHNRVTRPVPAQLAGEGRNAWLRQQLIPRLDVQVEWALAVKDEAPRLFKLGEGLSSIVSRYNYEIGVPREPVSLGGTSTSSGAPTAPGASIDLTSPFPADGIIAFTPFDEVWLLPTADAARRYLAAACARRRALLNLAADWETAKNNSNGLCWTPVLTQPQLNAERLAARLGRSGSVEGLEEAEIGRYAALSQSAEVGRHSRMTGTSTVPDKALPFLSDPRVRAIAMRLAAGSEPLDWVSADSLVANAFRDGDAEKVLLSTGTILYKLNDLPALIPQGANTERFIVSPWWSPLGDFRHGETWGEPKIAPELLQRFTDATPGAPPLDDPDKLREWVSALPNAGPYLQNPRLGNAQLRAAVADRWNRLRYVVPIYLTRPVYAFFGDFSAGEQVNFAPKGQASWPTSAALSARQEAVPLLQGTTAPLSGAPGLALGEQATVGTQRQLVGASMPGGTTQLYIPNLRIADFSYVELELGGYATVELKHLGVSLTGPSGGFIRLIDLYGTKP